jgi:hypothetical protein
MRKQARFQRRLRLPDGRGANFHLPLLIFEEDGATICYCPALDLSGYGNNEAEAIQSYKHIMAEYFQYTTSKKTLLLDLRSRGWKVKALSRKMTPPDFSELLEKNDHFKRVFENYNFKKISTEVQIPMYA